jgi:hypothetical protein
MGSGRQKRDLLRQLFPASDRAMDGKRNEAEIDGEIAALEKSYETELAALRVKKEKAHILSLLSNQHHTTSAATSSSAQSRLHDPLLDRITAPTQNNLQFDNHDLSVERSLDDSLDGKCTSD